MQDLDQGHQTVRAALMTRAPTEKSGQFTFQSIDDAMSFQSYRAMCGRDVEIIGGGFAWRAIW